MNKSSNHPKSLNVLTGKTIIAAHIVNNRSTLCLTLSGGRTVNINSGLPIVIRIVEKQYKKPKLYAERPN